MKRLIKKKERKGKRDVGRGRANVFCFDRRLEKVELLAVGSGSRRRQEFSFNILSLVSAKINLASSHLPSDHVVGAAGVRGAGVLRWATKR